MFWDVRLSTCHSPTQLSARLSVGERQRLNCFTPKCSAMAPLAWFCELWIVHNNTEIGVRSVEPPPNPANAISRFTNTQCCLTHVDCDTKMVRILFIIILHEL